MTAPINKGKGIGAALAATKGKGGKMDPSKLAMLIKMLQHRQGMAPGGGAGPMPEGLGNLQLTGGRGPVIRGGR